MANKKNYSENRQRDSAVGGGGLLFFGFVAFVMVAFYLWGSVQIDFNMRENDRLENKRQTLQREVDDLYIQVNKFKSYQRVVELARKQGMVFLSASRLEKLVVDMDGIEYRAEGEEYKVNYAGIGLTGIQ